MKTITVNAQQVPVEFIQDVFKHFGVHPKTGLSILDPLYISAVHALAKHVIFGFENRNLVGIGLVSKDFRLKTFELVLATCPGKGRPIIETALDVARCNGTTLSVEAMGKKLTKHYEERYGFRKVMKAGEDNWLMILPYESWLLTNSTVQSSEPLDGQVS